MIYLITGKNGQLARAFARRITLMGGECSAPDEARLDITSAECVREAIRECKPGVIVNCAAYNAVDKAEQEPGAAFAVNAEGPRNLARAAREAKALFVHFGSDYVFDGLKENGLYTEADAVNPLNEYGRSKLAGEQAVLEEHDRPLVLRLSWVFGRGKQNFIYKLGEWAKTSEYLKIACDEFSAPTSADDVAEITLQAVNQGLTGRYHLTNSGYCSRYEWAREIMKGLGIRKFIRPVSMDAFHLPAKRPKFSAMSNDAIRIALNRTIDTWEEATAKFLREGGPADERH